MTNHRRRMLRHLGLYSNNPKGRRPMSRLEWAALALPILAIFAADCGGGTKEITDRRGCNPKDITTNNCVEVMR